MPQVHDRGLEAVQAATQNFATMFDTLGRGALVKDRLEEARRLREKEDAADAASKQLAATVLQSMKPQHPAELVYGPVPPDQIEGATKRQALFEQFTAMLPSLSGDAALQATDAFKGLLQDMAVDDARGRLATFIQDAIGDGRLPEGMAEYGMQVAETLQDPEAPIGMDAVAQIENVMVRAMMDQSRKVLNATYRQQTVDSLSQMAQALASTGALQPPQLMAFKSAISLIASGLYDESPSAIANLMGRALMTTDTEGRDPMRNSITLFEAMMRDGNMTADAAWQKALAFSGAGQQGPTPSGKPLGTQHLLALEGADPEQPERNAPVALTPEEGAARFEGVKQRLRAALDEGAPLSELREIAAEAVGHGEAQFLSRSDIRKILERLPEDGDQRPVNAPDLGFGDDRQSQQGVLDFARKHAREQRNPQ